MEHWVVSAADNIAGIDLSFVTREAPCVTASGPESKKHGCLLDVVTAIHSLT